MVRGLEEEMRCPRLPGDRVVLRCASQAARRSALSAREGGLLQPLRYLHVGWGVGSGPRRSWPFGSVPTVVQGGWRGAGCIGVAAGGSQAAATRVCLQVLGLLGGEHSVEQRRWLQRAWQAVAG